MYNTRKSVIDVHYRKEKECAWVRNFFDNKWYARFIFSPISFVQNCSGTIEHLIDVLIIERAIEIHVWNTKELDLT